MFTVTVVSQDAEKYAEGEGPFQKGEEGSTYLPTYLIHTYIPESFKKNFLLIQNLTSVPYKVSVRTSTVPELKLNRFLDITKG